MASTDKKVSPFNIFKGASWTQGRKRAKQANLGDENNMYYHPELKRWVERGKEEEAEREAAGPPPPPVVSGGSFSAAPLAKRSLSQRYVLQPNLSVSSIASLAGSTSQTDLASLVGGAADGSFSGPPSAIGSTAPSPPQSGRGLLLPAAYASGPPSATAPSANSFFLPAAPSPGSFFLPRPAASEDGPLDRPLEPGTAPQEGAAAAAGPGDAAAPQSRAHEEPETGRAAAKRASHAGAGAGADANGSASCAGAAGDAAADDDDNGGAANGSAPCSVSSSSKAKSVGGADCDAAAAAAASNGTEAGGSTTATGFGGGIPERRPAMGRLLAPRVEAADGADAAEGSRGGDGGVYGQGHGDGHGLASQPFDEAAAAAAADPAGPWDPVDPSSSSDCPVLLPPVLSQATELSLRHSLVGSSWGLPRESSPLSQQPQGRLMGGDGGGGGADGAPCEGRRCSLSFPAPLGTHPAAGSLGTLASPASRFHHHHHHHHINQHHHDQHDQQHHQQQKPQQQEQQQQQQCHQQQLPLSPQVLRRWGSGGVVNPSDGGAAISLHEGMGFLPAARPNAAREGMAESGYEDAAGAAEAEVAAGQSEAVGAAEAEGAVPVGEVEVQPPAAEGPAQPEAGSGSVGGAVEAAASVAVATAEGAAEASSSALYSQYYYQQYAYLYQYAVQQGYGEADAVAYAQYYAATYAQQYEAQSPQGLVGSGMTGGEDEAAVATEGVAVAEAGTPGQQPTAEEGGGQAAGGAGAAEATVMSVTEQAVQPGEPAWQAVAEAAEDEASDLVGAGSAARGLEGGHEAAAAAEDPVYHTAEPSAAAAGAPLLLRRIAEAETEAGVGPQVVEAEASTAAFSAAPLPADLTAAAAAAAQHHQSAVTAAVAAAAAAAAAVDEDERPALGQQARGEHLSARDQSASGAVGPQLLLGLGAAGAKRLTQLSSAATAAVASLGATVAATAPVAAALSAASAAATAAASMRLDGAGLSEDDFERIMHPGDPAKLDGPLPWELPDHLRTGRKFLALCSNWQLANPGLPYAPHLLLEQPQQAEATPAAEAGRQQHEGEAEGAAVMANGGSDVALAAEGGSGSGGGAVAVAADQQPQQPQQSPAVEVLSSYERACRLAEFGQPVAGLAPHQQVVTERQQQQRQQEATVKASAVAAVAATDVVASSCSTEKPPQQQQPSGADAAPLTAPTAPAAVSVAVSRTPQALDLGSLPAVDSPTLPGHEQPAPGSARSEDPFAGAEHVPLAEQMRQQPSPLASPVRVPYDGAGLAEEQVQLAAVPEPPAAPVAAASFAPLGSVEAASFFEHLCDEAAVPSGPAAAQSEAAAAPPEASAVEQPSEAPGTEVGEQAVGPVADDDAAVPAATLVAAAAIDSVVQALEQLRCKAATANTDDGTTAAASPDSTSLLLQIHSSLAQATQALAGLGVDVSALASLAGAAQEHAQDVVAAEWTPGPGSKRPRMDASPSTPTRPVPTAAENVVTPVLPPGPPVMRAAVVEGGGEEGPAAGATGPGERFQQLGRRLSDASAEAAARVGAEAAAPSAQQPAVVLSLTIAAPPEVDVAAVEERARSEERAGWEARLGAVVDSEREAAALVIAVVEQERDGLQCRVGELEGQLVAVTAERDGLAQRLVEAEAGSQQALAAARAEAEAERGVLAAQLSSALAERDGLAAQLAIERSEKAALSEAVSVARAEGEDLRRRYAERFASLTSELEATRGSLTELQAEHDELLLCLGQESTKVATLVDALREAGCDPDPMLERIEAEYETMGLGDSGQGQEEEEEGGGAKAVERGQELPAGEAGEEGAGDGWEGEEVAI